MRNILEKLSVRLTLRFTGCFNPLVMRSLFIFLLFFLNASCPGQSLKDSLFSGKLKVDSALLIKSKANVTKPPPDSAQKALPASEKKAGADSLVKQSGAEKTEIKFSDNNKIWKKFVDEYTATITSEISSTKKVKRGTYSVMIDYEIGTDGAITTKNVTCTPGSDYLVEQIKERMMPNAPRLAPLIREGVARKSVKRQMIVFTKEKN